MAESAFFVALIAVACCTCLVDSLQLQANPGTFLPGVTTNLTLRCTPGDTVSDLSTIDVFQLSKDGVLLATGRPEGVILAESLRTSKYSVTDQIDMDNVSNSFLLFTILFPEAEDEGEYTCHMNYQDQGGFFQNVDGKLVVHQNATDDVNVQKQLEQTLQLVENLMTRINTLETQVFDLANDNKNNSRRIAALDEVSSSHIGFFATLSDKVYILKDQIVVFNHLKFNSGGGFNDTSGVFVAPNSGFYVLNLVCEVHTDVAIRMEIQLLVDGHVATKLYITGETVGHGGQQSGSLIYDIGAGAEVKIVVGNIQTDSVTQVELMGDNLSYFSGYFLG